MNTYYVYGHYDQDGACVYIGKGQKSRAWDIHSGHSKTKNYSKARNAWFKEQLDIGRLPCDWVHILVRDLSSNAALIWEEREIKRRKPPLNVTTRSAASDGRKGVL
jgi:hypothetical protein